MIQDSQPLASRGRKTVVLAVFVFLLAGLFSLIGKQTTTKSPPLAGDTLVPIGQLSNSFAESSRDTLSAVNTPPQRTGKRSSSGSVYVLLILAAGALLALWLKRSRRPTESPGMLQTVARLPLPHNQELRVIRVRNTELVVGVSPSALTVLHRFDVAAQHIAEDQQTNVDSASISNKIGNGVAIGVIDNISISAGSSIANGIVDKESDDVTNAAARHEPRPSSTFQEMLHSSLGKRPARTRSKKVTIDV